MDIGTLLNGARARARAHARGEGGPTGRASDHTMPG